MHASILLSRFQIHAKPTQIHLSVAKEFWGICKEFWILVSCTRKGEKLELHGYFELIDNKNSTLSQAFSLGSRVISWL